MKSKNNCPLSSFMPLSAPASLQLWHGGPPIIPSQFGTFSASTSVMLRLSRVVSGKFSSKVGKIFCQIRSRKLF